MNRKLAIVPFAAAICTGVVNISAVQIDGNLNFGSDTEVSLTPAGTTDFHLATGIHFLPGSGPGGANATATSVTAGSALDAIVNPGDWFTFSDFLLDGSAANGIWTGPGGLVFDLGEGGLKSVSGSGNSLTYEGFGTISATGYEITDGYFTFTTQKTPIGATLHFSFSAVSAGNEALVPNEVPDAGSTGVLLLGSLIGAAGLYRRCR